VKLYVNNYRDLPGEKFLNPHVPRFKVLKVIGTDTDRSAIYNFLLVFHSN